MTNNCCDNHKTLLDVLIQLESKVTALYLASIIVCLISLFVSASILCGLMLGLQACPELQHLLGVSSVGLSIVSTAFAIKALRVRRALNILMR